MSVTTQPAATFSPGQRLRSLTAVTAGACIAGATFGLTMPLLALILEGQGVDPTWTGLNAAAASLGILMFAFLVPRVLDRLGVLPAMYASVAAACAMFLLLPVFPGLGSWFVLRFLIGAAIAIHWIGSETWLIAITEKHDRGRIVAIYMTFLSAGFAGGPLLIGFVGTEGWTPFLVSAGLLAAMALPLSLAHNCVPRLPPRSPAAFRDTFRISPLILVAALLTGFTDLAKISLFPVYIIRIGLDQDTAVLMLSAILAGMVVMQLPIGWLADKVDRRRLLVLFGAVLLLIPPVFPWLLAHPILLWPVLVLWGGISFGMYTVALMLIGDRFPPAALASANAAFVTIVEAGGMTGPIVAGAGMDAFGPDGFLIVLAAAAGLFLCVAAGCSIRRVPD